MMNCKINIVLFLIFWANIMFAQNLALHLDGVDNNVRTGIGFLESPWTLEAWIKGDDTSWKQCETIFGGGEYSTYKKSDNFPLIVKEGKLYSQKAGIGSNKWLDDKWHHVALSCSETSISLFLDGKLEAYKDTTLIIIPGVLGASEMSESVFGGFMDEVRIWKTSLSQSDINEWMNKPLTYEHKFFKDLLAYYTFDSGIDDMSLNYVGSGYHSYHLRNGRINYSGNSQIATTILNDNENFFPYNGEQRLFNSISIESEWDSDKGSKNEQLSKLRLIVQGEKNPLKIEEIFLDLSDTKRLSDIDSIHVYYAGKSPRDSIRTLISSFSPKNKFSFRIKENNQIILTEGINYLLVTADVSKKAKVGNRLSAVIPKIVLNGKVYNSEIRKNNMSKLVSENSLTNPDIFRVLQWNIWHGGRHVPLEGHNRIIELIKHSNADIITMQEGYGSQEKIADALQFNLQTSSPDANLALYSRYPLIKEKSSDSFRSNIAVVKFSDERSLLINDCWVSYSYNPDYTGSFPDIGHNINGWIAEDSILPMANTRDILLKDIDRVEDSNLMPVILGGDFNSCSHLDWTKRASHLHAGYGPVDFPTSRFLLEKGYNDSFRVINPDEVRCPEGTFAGIYGQLDFSRIDFIYYKGKQIRPIQSKIIQTAPEIDDIWASDHSAVMTTFKWE